MLYILILDIYLNIEFGENKRYNITNNTLVNVIITYKNNINR